MPPVARGRGRGGAQRGRGAASKRTSVNLLIKNAKSATPVEASAERREQIEQEVAQLLSQTNLHNKEEQKEGDSLDSSVKNAEDTTELEEIERKLIPPKQRYQLPTENLVEQISRDIEWCAEVTSVTTKLNATEPQKVIDHLKVVPVERWAPINTVWKNLWTKRNSELIGTHENDLLDHVFDAFEEDLRHLKKGLHKTLGKLDREALHLDKNEWELKENHQSIKRPYAAAAAAAEFSKYDERRESKKRRLEGQWLIHYLETTKKVTHEETNEPFWNVMDPDHEIYTDSDEELTQTCLRHAPFIRPLRKIIRDIKKKEQIYTICGRSLRIFDETQNVEDIVKDNVDVVENELYSEEYKERSLNRCAWRQWNNAANYAKWRETAKPTLSLSQFSRNLYTTLTPDLSNSLEFFQIVSSYHDIPSTKFCRTFLRYFAKCLPHKLDKSYLNDAVSDVTWPLKYSPFDWFIPNQEVLTCPSSKSLQSDDNTLFKIKMGAPGMRFYTGRALSIWGGPAADGFQRTQMASEFFMYLRRLIGPFSPLHPMVYHKPRKQRPRIEAAKLSAAKNALEAKKTEAVGDASAMTDAMAMQSDLGTSSAFDMSLGGGSAWGVATKVTTEKDSSESETDLKVRAKEEQLGRVIEKDPSKASFYWSGYGHDNDCYRIGRFGHLRNVWNRPKRKRLGVEIVPELEKGKPSGRPIAPNYSSSEDSCTALTVDQKQFREKPRRTRKLIKKQKDRVLELRRAMRTSIENKEVKKRDREAEVLSSLYGHNLGPLELKFDMPTLRKDWPGSPLDLYEFQLENKKKTEEMKTTGLENRLEMALSTTQRLGLHEECWTHLTEKKGRVRGIEAKNDSDPSSKIPLGFMTFGTDLKGSEYQLVGIDQNELWRRFGDNKLMASTLHGYEDLLKGCRDYYVIVDEIGHEMTVVPGGTLSLYWTKSAKQNYRDLHWHSLWRFWLTGKFRRRLTQKSLRYKKLHHQGYYCWQDDLDRMLKIQDRISEGCAFRKAKYTRPRTHAFSARRDLDKKSCYDIPSLLSAPASDTNLIECLSDSDGDDIVVAQVADKITIKQMNENDVVLSSEKSVEDPDDISDWENEDGPMIPRGQFKKNSDFEEEATLCRTEAERLFRKYQYSTLFTRPQFNAPKWSLSWRNQKNKIASGLAKRYGHILSRYYHGYLPQFESEYKEARAMMAEKHKAETEFALLSRKIQQKKAEMGGPSDTGSVLNQQLSGAVAVMNETDSQKQQTSGTKTTEEVITEERNKRITAMQMCLPAFDLDATTPENIYKLNDVLPMHLIQNLSPAPIQGFFEKGFPANLAGSGEWTHTVLQLLQQIRSNQLSAEGSQTLGNNITQSARILKILNWLIKFYTICSKNWRTSNALSRQLNRLCKSADKSDSSTTSIPENVCQWLMDRFMVTDETGEFYTKQDGEIRLMTTILWLILYLANNEWKFKFNCLLTSDWGDKHTEKFQNWAKLMGMNRIWTTRRGELNQDITQPQEWALVAPIPVSEEISKGRGLIGAVDAAFGKSAAAVFFKEEAERQILQNRRGRGGSNRRGGRG